MAAANDSLQPGAEIFGYQIEKVIGRGGMGTVYLAQQLSLKRQVALKVLNPQRIKNPAQIEDFLREARNAAKLSHPHLVLVHDVHADAERGLYCYSMEYCPGTTAAKLVAEQGTLKRPAALHIVYQVAKALGHAHRHGLVHRDVKPDNILVGRNGLAKLADLGLVRDRLGGITSGSPKLLTLVGTPEYSAPEQSRNPQRATPASDVYSLGACMFFLLTGRPPFSGETVIDLIVTAATEALEYPAAITKDCCALIEGMLAKDQADRFVDGDAVVAALEAVAKGQPIPSPATGNGNGNGKPDDETEHDGSAVEGRDSLAKPRRRASRRRR